MFFEEFAFYVRRFFRSRVGLDSGLDSYDAVTHPDVIVEGSSIARACLSSRNLSV